VHLYGKAPRDGRKLGHVTALGPDPETALATAREATALLEAA
jgi:5-(carboxyamino)imidazole ribonucleotide synthase